jgi:hypothetical protein
VQTRVIQLLEDYIYLIIKIIASFSRNGEFSYALNGEVAVRLNRPYKLIKVAVISILITVILFIFSGCSKKPRRNVMYAFYYWRDSFILAKSDIEYLKATKVDKLYIRFFDVDWDPIRNIPVPIGDVNIQTDSLPNIEIVPTIFITNRTLININDSLVQKLSQKIYEKISSILKIFNNPSIKEIQLDCDWAKETRYKYFHLIQFLEKTAINQNIFLSATIRLHQIKYFNNTGVPPIRRGMLMFYNMTPVSNIRAKNSIFDSDVAEKYLTNFDKYPLPLDVALPAFSWGALYRRDKLAALINNITEKKLLGDADFKALDKIHFMVLRDKLYEGQFIKKFDTIRIEEISPAITKFSAEMISPLIRNDSLTVAIYHFNEELEKNYETKEMQNIFSVFR